MGQGISSEQERYLLQHQQQQQEQEQEQHERQQHEQRQRQRPRERGDEGSVGGLGGPEEERAQPPPAAPPAIPPPAPAAALAATVLPSCWDELIDWCDAATALSSRVWEPETEDPPAAMRIPPPPPSLLHQQHPPQPLLLNESYVVSNINDNCYTINSRSSRSSRNGRCVRDDGEDEEDGSKYQNQQLRLQSQQRLRSQRRRRHRRGGGMARFVPYVTRRAAVRRGRAVLPRQLQPNGSGGGGSLPRRNGGFVRRFFHSRRRCRGRTTTTTTEGGGDNATTEVSWMDQARFYAEHVLIVVQLSQTGDILCALPIGAFYRYLTILRRLSDLLSLQETQTQTRQQHEQEGIHQQQQPQQRHTSNDEDGLLPSFDDGFGDADLKVLSLLPDTEMRYSQQEQMMETERRYHHRQNEEPQELQSCTICYNGVEEAVLKCCGHGICRDCEQRWVRQKLQCPYCRERFRTPRDVQQNGTWDLTSAMWTQQDYDIHLRQDIHTLRKRIVDFWKQQSNLLMMDIDDTRALIESSYIDLPRNIEIIENRKGYNNNDDEQDHRDDRSSGFFKQEDWDRDHDADDDDDFVIVVQRHPTLFPPHNDETDPIDLRAKPTLQHCKTQERYAEEEIIFVTE